MSKKTPKPPVEMWALWDAGEAGWFEAHDSGLCGWSGAAVWFPDKETVREAADFISGELSIRPRLVPHRIFPPKEPRP